MNVDPEVLALLVGYADRTASKLNDDIQANALNELYAILSTREGQMPDERRFRNIAYSRYNWSVTQFDEWAQGKTWAT